MATFNKNTEKHLGAKLTHNELEEVGIPDTSEYVPYADEDQNEMKFPDWDEEFPPEVGDKYIHLSVMLPCGSQMIHCTFIASKWECDGHPIGC